MKDTVKIEKGRVLMVAHRGVSGIECETTNAAFVAAAILGKIVGCGFIYKVTGHSFRDALIVGVGMMTRGEVALIVTQKGLDAGLIAPEYFAPVIILIIFTSVLTPILLKVLFGKEKKVAATEG